MQGWSRRSLKAWVVPGGVLLLFAAALLQGGFLTLSAPAIDFYYFAVFAAGFLLAWRFHSSRVMFALVTLLLAHRALEFFTSGRILPSGPGRIAFEAVAFLIPVNLVVSSFVQERGLTVPAIASRLGLLFIESVFVAIICRPGEFVGPWFLRAALLEHSLFLWTKIPQPALAVFTLAFGVLLVRFLLYHKPVESGLFWALAATFFGLQVGGVDRLGSAYFATAGLILAASIVENSYVLAYHDELTTLPSRRAFNDVLLGLEAPYAVAMADIDHFKSFNDTFGHDAGDQVLRMVAMRLAAVTGGGQAYRVGGEEFAILFPGKSAKEALPHLELLRQTIADSRFRFRGSPERRTAPRGPDRRRTAGRRTARARWPNPHELSSDQVSVTVSIGIAASTATKGRPAEQVIQHADQALYRAKRAGRNRVETETAARTRSPRIKRSIA